MRRRRRRIPLGFKSSATIEMEKKTQPTATTFVFPVLVSSSMIEKLLLCKTGQADPSVQSAMRMSEILLLPSLENRFVPKKNEMTTKQSGFLSRLPSDGRFLIGTEAVWTQCWTQSWQSAFIAAACSELQHLFRFKVFCCLGDGCWRRASPLPLKLWCFDRAEPQRRSGKSQRGQTGDKHWWGLNVTCDLRN